MLKTLGYFISTLSVLLLGSVSWKATETDMTLRLFLLAGMAASVLGMFLRWLSYRLQERPGTQPRAQAGPAQRMS